jgi:hypothetical protein
MFLDSELERYNSRPHDRPPALFQFILLIGGTLSRRQNATACVLKQLCTGNGTGTGNWSLALALALATGTGTDNWALALALATGHWH